MLKRLLTFTISIMGVLTANALEIPEIFGDNMILQQQTKAKVWGWAEVGHYIKVTASWSADEYVAKVDADGSWKVEVKTPDARMPARWHLLFHSRLKALMELRPWQHISRGSVLNMM